MMDDPLFSPGWIRFNEMQWGLKAERIVLGPKKGTSWELETIIYRNKKGQLIKPLRNPHLPVVFSSTSERPFTLNRRKRLAIDELATFYKKNKFASDLTLSHIVNDVRPFLWQGFIVSPKYTYHIDITSPGQKTDPKAINIVRKAIKLGYTCETTLDFDAVVKCQYAPYFRQGKSISGFLTVDEFQSIYNLIGDKGFVAFLCCDSKGKPQGASIHFFVPGGWAMDWSSGVETTALKNGANYLLNEFAINFFTEKHCKIYDFAGANIPSIAASKEAWGGDLVCYFSIRQPNVKNEIRNRIFKPGYRYLKRQLKR